MTIGYLEEITFSDKLANCSKFVYYLLNCSIFFESNKLLFLLL